MENTTFFRTIGLALFLSTIATAALRDQQSLTQYLAKHPEVDRIEKLLPALAPELLANVELVGVSRSQQEASPTTPRVIAWGPDGKFMIAFNGDPSQKGYDVLETIQYHDDGTISFKSYRFKGDTSARASWLASHQKAPDKFFACATCHRENSRWNWDTYQTRPGVIAGFGGEVRLGDAMAKSPRYRFLGARKDMAQALGELQAKWMTNQIPRQIADWQKWKFAVLAASARCPDIESFLPFSAKTYGYPSWSELHDQTVKAGLYYNDARIARVEAMRSTGLDLETYSRGDDDHYHIAGPTQTSVAVTSLRYVLQWVGVDLDQFSTTLEHKTYGFRISGYHLFSTNNAGTDPHQPPKLLYDSSLFLHLAKREGLEKEAAIAILDHDSHGALPNCDWLKAQSLKALKDVTPGPPPELSAPKKAPSH